MSVDARTMDFYDKYVTELIMNKYGYSEMDAFREFVQSKARQMLSDKSYCFYKDSPLIIFDMWECEKISGDPCNSVYIREMV